MTDVALVPISWIRTVAGIGALLVAGVFFLGRCTAPPGLPPAVQAAVDRHDSLIVVDTAAVNRLEREKVAARRRELSATAARRVSDSVAAVERTRADSLAVVAAAAHTSADSAAAWQAAYVARSLEADSLRGSLAHAGAVLEALAAGLAAADSIGAVWRSRALRADTVIARLKPLVAEASRRWRAGVTLGAGCGYNGCGPQITAGATYEVRLPKVSLPFTGGR